MITSNYENFIAKVYALLNDAGIDTYQLRIDHIGYQARSAADYDQQILELAGASHQVSESIVGNRRVGIFRLTQSLQFGSQEFSVIEIFEPREGQNVNSAWEHVEFLTQVSLEEFMNQYSSLNWDKSVMDRAEFPMLILQLAPGIRAKFPRRGVLAELQKQQNN